MFTRFKRKLVRAREIFFTEGGISLFKNVVGFVYTNSIRRGLPTLGYYTNAGIPVQRRKPFDSVIPGINYKNNPDHEYAIVSELQEYVEPGDSVVIVGAGSGTTSVVAANQATHSGSVVAFEGSANSVQRAQNTVSLNRVHDRCNVRHSIVGPAIHVSPDGQNKSEVEHINPNELPECDVLELDCEGAEKKILEELNITPRIIIVETHPDFGSGTKDIRKILEKQGYIIINQIDRGTVPVLTAMFDSES